MAERLTARNERGFGYFPYCFREDTCVGWGYSEKCDTCEFTVKICEKLAAYEDAEEKSRDIKPGDTVYFAWPDQDIVTPAVVQDVGTKFLIFEDFLEPIENLGVRVFRTEQEAWSALKDKK